MPTTGLQDNSTHGYQYRRDDGLHEAYQNSVEDEQTGEQSDYLARGNYIVASLPREGTQHSHGADVLRTTDLCDDHSGPYHVRQTELRRRESSNLT